MTKKNKNDLKMIFGRVVRKPSVINNKQLIFQKIVS